MVLINLLSFLLFFSFSFFGYNSRNQKGSSGEREVLCNIEFLALSWVNFKGAISLGKHKEDPLSEKKKEVQHFTKALPSRGDKCPFKESWKVDS